MPFTILSVTYTRSHWIIISTQERYTAIAHISRNRKRLGNISIQMTEEPLSSSLRNQTIKNNPCLFLSWKFHVCCYIYSKVNSFKIMCSLIVLQYFGVEGIFYIIKNSKHWYFVVILLEGYMSHCDWWTWLMFLRMHSTVSMPHLQM